MNSKFYSPPSINRKSIRKGGCYLVSIKNARCNIRISDHRQKILPSARGQRGQEKVREDARAARAQWVGGGSSLSQQGRKARKNYFLKRKRFLLYLLKMIQFLRVLCCRGAASRGMGCRAAGAPPLTSGSVFWIYVSSLVK